MQLARRRVQGDEDVLARPVTRGLDALDEDPQRRLVRVEVGREAALVADRGGEPAAGQRPLEGVEDLRAHAQGLGERRGAGGNDHELLEVDGVVRVRPAVEDVHHRHGQDPRGVAAEVAPERQGLLGRRRVRGRERHAEDRVRAETTLARCPVEVDHEPVEAGLVGGVVAVDGPAELAVDVRHRPLHALAAPPLAAVAQLGGLELAGRGARRHRRPAVGARAQAEVDLDGRVAPRVEDLAGVDVLDLAQSGSSARDRR